MRTSIKNICQLIMLMHCPGLIPAGHVAAQTFTTLHSFRGTSDGVTPYDGLILSGSTLYGTTAYGGSAGSSGGGTVFKVNTDGTGFRNLHSFNATSGPLFTNSDGANPIVGVILVDNTLYGTAYRGGSSGNGTVFALETDGTGFRNLYNFTAGSGGSTGVYAQGTNSDGASPSAPLVLSGNTLYGTALGGGNSGNGTVFALSTDGTGFTDLYSFTTASGDSSAWYWNWNVTNSDGAWPLAALVLSGNTMYGTAASGGSSGNGTVFAVNADGTGFTNLHTFAAVNDGGQPFAGLILSGDTLYGTTANPGSSTSGSSSNGTVFKVNTNGTGFTILHRFAAFSTNANRLGYYANSDGAWPNGLIISGSTLYGTTAGGGSLGNGTVFAINTNGTGFNSLYSFTGGSDGANPEAGLILSGNILYGAAAQGGTSGGGTVFSIILPVSQPHLSITASGANVILTWPTNATGFNLQSTTNLGLSAVWTTNLAAPVVVNGQNTVTNPISGRQEFFRLSQ